MTWQRARSEEQKEARVDEIIKATERLFKNSPFEAITFAAIAKEAQFTRSNLYKYFNSKEEIFLAFLRHDVNAWRDELLQSFTAETSLSVEEFSGKWVALQLKHKRMLELIAILYTELEKHISLQHLVDFKEQIKEEFTTVGELLVRLFPKLSPEKATQFLQLQFASAIGLYQMTDLTELQQEVLAYPEYQHLQIDLESAYRQSVAAILNSLLN